MSLDALTGKGSTLQIPERRISRTATTTSTLDRDAHVETPPRLSAERSEAASSSLSPAHPRVFCNRHADPEGVTISRWPHVRRPLIRLNALPAVIMKSTTITRRDREAIQHYECSRVSLLKELHSTVRWSRREFIHSALSASALAACRLLVFRM